MSENAHVIALLGKSHARQSTEISREFARRLDGFSNVVSKAPPANLHLAICGHREAKPAMDWLQREHAQLLPPPARRFVDDLSRTSIQNFEALGGYLTSLLSPPYRRIRLTIVSSDYHLSRLRFVDEHLRPQSLANSVASAVEPELLCWEGVPLLQSPHAADAIRWCSQVYSLAEMLMPLQINIEGILLLRLRRIVAAVYSRFCLSLSALEKLLHSPPEQIQTEFRPTLDDARQAVESIARLPDRLATHVEFTRESAPKLQDTLEVLRDALRRLRTATDLDGPEFDGLYPGLFT